MKSFNFTTVVKLKVNFKSLHLKKKYFSFGLNWIRLTVGGAESLAVKT